MYISKKKVNFMNDDYTLNQLAQILGALRFDELTDDQRNTWNTLTNNNLTDDQRNILVNSTNFVQPNPTVAELVHAFQTFHLGDQGNIGDNFSTPPPRNHDDIRNHDIDRVNHTQVLTPEQDAMVIDVALTPNDVNPLSVAMNLSEEFNRASNFDNEALQPVTRNLLGAFNRVSDNREGAYIPFPNLGNNDELGVVGMFDNFDNNDANHLPYQ
ncbi:MAG: hypothetical protein SFT93_02275 [Rickettsiaceae bacterium]|nr:hypothetical protein [Rickettsiaceae bacterium]